VLGRGPKGDRLRTPGAKASSTILLRSSRLLVRRRSQLRHAPPFGVHLTFRWTPNLIKCRLTGGHQISLTLRRLHPILLLPIEIGRVADPAFRQMSATGTPSAPCRRMNAFWASENFEAFTVFRSCQPGENNAENSNPERPSFQGAESDDVEGRKPSGFVKSG
jgi:hypothetical protein